MQECGCVMSNAIPDYGYGYSEATYSNSYTWPVVRDVAATLDTASPRRAFDLGCGNGATAHMVSQLGFDEVGVDTSQSGIAVAKKAYPNCTFTVAGAYDDLGSVYGQFAMVMSLEVVEHCFDPRKYGQTLFDLVAPGGTAVVSTPYHGYLKNVALAVSGKLDAHFTALWDGGTSSSSRSKHLARSCPRLDLSASGSCGLAACPPFAKSMVAIARRPK